MVPTQTKYCLITAVLSLTVQVVHSAADPYTEPYGGPDYVYKATNDVLPSVASSDGMQPVWNRYGYSTSQGSGPGQVQMVPLGDPLTSLEPLRMTNTATSGAAQYAYYELGSGGGSGTSEDYYTLDTRFRLLDVSSADQFSILVFRPPTALQASGNETEHKYSFRFSRTGITTGISSGSALTPYALGTTWRNARIIVDMPNSIARLYMDGSTDPIIGNYEGAGGSSSSRNSMRFGDGSSLVSGRVDLYSMEWSNDVMAMPLDGGQVEFHNHVKVVEDLDNHLNFPFATRFNNGVIWLTHSVGTHTQDETSATLWSLDNGATWASPTNNAITGINVYQLGAGNVLALAAWNHAYSTSHDILVRRWATPTSNQTLQTVTVQLPWSAQLFLHRTMIEAGDGSLVQTAYTRMNGAGNFRSFALRSTNGGNSWSYAGSIAYDALAASNTGYSETSIVKLADDTLLALIRYGSPATPGPLMQSKSTDNGITWSAPSQIASYSADPHVIRLANGSLVASSGRPGLFLLVDFSGTGNNWQEIEYYSGSGSSYTTLVEIEDNVVRMFYDRSGFLLSGDLPATVPNTLASVDVRVRIDN